MLLIMKFNHYFSCNCLLHVKFQQLSNIFQLFMTLVLGSVRRENPKGSKIHNGLLIIKQVAKEGIPLPPDRTICLLCSQKRANPSVVTISGFVFCYACIFKYLSQVRNLVPFSINIHISASSLVFLPILLPYLAKIYLFHDAILFHCCSITAAQSH
jgi:hypothetical protein